MKSRLLRRLRGVGLMAALALPVMAQGLYWESTTTKFGDKDKGHTSQFYYMPKMYKATMDDNQQVVIVRLDKEVMMMMDNKEKTYWQLTFAEMESMMKGVGSKMDAAMAEMDEKMKDMPEEQRKMVEKMMGGRMGKKNAKIDIEKTDESKTVSGYKCKKYVLKMGDDELATVWATQDISDFGVMRKDMEEFGKRMSAMLPRGMEGSVEKSLSTLDGFPIQTERKNGSVMTVTKIEKKSTPTSEFEAPSGYKKEAPPIMEHKGKIDKGE